MKKLGECDECGTMYSYDPTDGGSICVRCLRDSLDRLRLQLSESQKALDIAERVAQITAHRACGGNEHDGMGKLHGYCVVCLIPWPCEYAGKPPALAALPKPEPVTDKAGEEL